MESSSSDALPSESSPSSFSLSSSLGGFLFFLISPFCTFCSKLSILSIRACTMGFGSAAFAAEASNSWIFNFKARFAFSASAKRLSAAWQTESEEGSYVSSIDLDTYRVFQNEIAWAMITVSVMYSGQQNWSNTEFSLFIQVFPKGALTGFHHWYHSPGSHSAWSTCHRVTKFLAFLRNIQINKYIYINTSHRSILNRAYRYIDIHIYIYNICLFVYLYIDGTCHAYLSAKVSYIYRPKLCWITTRQNSAGIVGAGDAVLGPWTLDDGMLNQ